MPLQWHKGTKQQFEKLPEPQPRSGAPDPEWNEAITALADGEVIVIPYASDPERRRHARVLGRRAATHGFRVQIRYDESKNVLVAAKGQTLTNEERERTRGGRRRKQTNPPV